MKKTLVFFSYLLLMCSFFATAQRFEPGIGIGVGNSSNDIATSYQVYNSRLGGEIFCRYNLSPISAFRLSIGAMQFRGADAEYGALYQKNRDLSFRSDLIEACMRYEYNFINFRSQSELRRLSPFLFSGISFAKFASKTNLHPAIKSSTLAIPLGLGFKYAMAYNWNLSVEMGMRFTFTDVLEGFDSSKEITKFQRGNLIDNDSYYYTGITISYLFEGIICPHRFKK